MQKEKSGLYGMLLMVLVWGGLWGIFEATAGYLLHLLPFSIGWLVWYPVACFFMLNVYRKTRKIEAVLLVGLLAAGIKLVNLFFPGRIDRVLNPAVSILFEALALAAIIWAVKRFSGGKKISLPVKALAILCMNTGWRALYALYLLLLVPDWIREVSVISSPAALVTFFITHNLFTSLLLLACTLVSAQALRPIKALEGRVEAGLCSLSGGVAAGIKIASAAVLTAGSIALGILM